MSTPSEQAAQRNELWLCGDLHGKTTHLYDAVSERLSNGYGKPSAWLLLGDLELEESFTNAFGAAERQGIEVWWISGNHDTDSEEFFERTFCDRLGQKRRIQAAPISLNGIKIAGLGGIFRGRAWNPKESSQAAFEDRAEMARQLLSKRPIRQRPETPLDPETAKGDAPLRKLFSTIFPTDLPRSDERARLLLTHEAPGCNPHGFSIIDQVADGLLAEAIVHGHHHLDRIETISTAPRKIVCGVGLRGILAFPSMETIRLGEIPARNEMHKGPTPPNTLNG